MSLDYRVLTEETRKFIPPIQELPEILNSFGRFQSKTDNIEIKKYFSQIPIQNLQKIFEFKKRKGMNIDNDCLHFEIFLNEYFNNLPLEQEKMIDGEVFSLEDDTEFFINIDFNKLLIKFLDEYPASKFEKEIEALFLIDLNIKSGIKLISKFLNHNDFAVSEQAFKLLKEQIKENKEETIKNIYLFLNNKCSLEEADQFYKFIREDPELFNNLYLDKLASIRLIFKGLEDKNNEFSERARKILDKIKENPYFLTQFENYLNNFSSPEDIAIIYSWYIKYNPELKNININYYGGLKLVLIACSDSNREISRNAFKILEEYLKENKNVSNILDYFISAYASEEELTSVIFLCLKNKYIFNQNEIDKLFKIGKKFIIFNNLIKKCIFISNKRYK
ncbi:MAG: hypothetical protein WC356_05395 [Candidatus Micrarchaeia archaeon]|jgi:hypothetical protein